MDIIDSLTINQVNLPVNDSIWLPFSSNTVLYAKIFGISINGKYLGGFSNYNLNPDFPKNFFKGEVMRVNEDSNKKDSAYWEKSRPVPLTKEETKDYILRDSLHNIRESKPYLDSIDKISNKFKIRSLFFGYNYYNRAKKQRYSYSSLTRNVKYNTVQGLVLGMNVNYNKELENRKRLNIGGLINYGFSNKKWNGQLGFIHYYKPKKSSFYSISIGREAKQFNSARPISTLINTAYSLLYEANYMKLYEKSYAGFIYNTEITNGLIFNGKIEYQNRKPLMNNSDFTFNDRENIDFTSNNPIFPENDSTFFFQEHQALNLSVQFRINIKQKYYTRPYQKINIGSKYPTIILNYKKGIKNFIGSDTNFDFLKLTIKDNLNFKLFGNSSYSISAGKFFNKKDIEFIDYHHFKGNQTIFSVFDNTSFNLLDYYTYSTNNYFLEAHLEHNLGGLLLKKIPLIRKLKLNEVVGIHYMKSNTLSNYFEFSVGIEKLRLVRLAFVSSFLNGKHHNTGIRLGLSMGGSIQIN